MLNSSTFYLQAEFLWIPSIPQEGNRSVEIVLGEFSLFLWRFRLLTVFSVYVFATRSVYLSSQFDINYDSHKLLSYEAASLFLLSVLFARVSLMSPGRIDNRLSNTLNVVSCEIIHPFAFSEQCTGRGKSQMQCNEVLCSCLRQSVQNICTQLSCSYPLVCPSQ